MENQTKEIVKINPEEFGLQEEKAKEIMGNLPQILSERAILEPQFGAVIKMDIDSPFTAKAAGELRKLIRNNRTKGIDVWHKTTKELFLKGGQFVDAIKRKESAVNERMESSLEEIEKHQEIIEANRKAELKAKRLEILTPICENAEIYPLSEMSDEAFNDLVNGFKLAAEKKAADEAKALADKLAKEKTEREEQERIRLENEKLKAEAIEREKAEKIEREKQAKILAEQKAKAEAEAKKAKEIADAQLKAEQEKAAIEKAKADKLAAELKAKAEAEAKEKARIEKEEKERIAEEKRKLKAPDKAKILSLCIQIENITYPAVNSNEAKEIIEKVKNLFGKITDFIKKESNNL